ncbi:hypothetical protein ACFE04_025111 [Oxalis oulophora]
MEFSQNLTCAAGELKLHQNPPLSEPGDSIDHLFPFQNTEIDMNLEWLSVFVEDCLSSNTTNCFPITTTTTTTSPQNHVIDQNKTPTFTPTNIKKPVSSNLDKSIIVPSKKARTKRTRKPKNKHNPLTSWCSKLYPFNQNLNFTSYEYPPLLKQAYWLADSELIITKQEEKEDDELVEVVVVQETGNGGGGRQEQQQQQGRKCGHCLSQRTPQWRAGPMGPRTLCNACGVRYKSGRLFPEYRPAKSPTFVSYLHSNSHKKVLEMRNNGFTSY